MEGESLEFAPRDVVSKAPLGSSEVSLSSLSCPSQTHLEVPQHLGVSYRAAMTPPGMPAAERFGPVPLGPQ